MNSIHEAIENRFRADAQLMTLAPNGIDFERSRNKAVNRVLFLESDDSGVITRGYGYVSREYRFTFYIFAETKLRADEIMSRMFEVFDGSALTLAAGENGWGGEFLSGIRTYEQEQARQESTVNTVWVCEMPYTHSAVTVQQNQ